MHGKAKKEKSALKQGGKTDVAFPQITLSRACNNLHSVLGSLLYLTDRAMPLAATRLGFTLTRNAVVSWTRTLHPSPVQGCSCTAGNL